MSILEYAKNYNWVLTKTPKETISLMKNSDRKLFLFIGKEYLCNKKFSLKIYYSNSRYFLFYDNDKLDFYPELINKTSLFNRWKESANWAYKNWKELFDVLKTSGVKYRRSLDLFEFKVFRLMSSKSNVIFYKIYNSLE